MKRWLFLWSLLTGCAEHHVLQAELSAVEPELDAGVENVPEHRPDGWPLIR